MISFKFAVMAPVRFTASLCSWSSRNSRILLDKMRRFLFLLAGISFLVLTACAGGGGGGSSGGPEAFEVKLTFAPIDNGFRIANQSTFGDFVSLNITATSGDTVVKKGDIDITEFVDNGYYEFTGLAELEWKFEIIGISDGGEQEVGIDFIWQENEDDHDNGGIWSGANYDGDARADRADNDDDNDGVNDTHPDNCPRGGDTGWTSNNSNDHDGDGCQDASEDEDDDNDGINDGPDGCPKGVTGWMSNSSSDNDGDGCQDATEDKDGGQVADDDNDGHTNGVDVDDDGDGLIEIANATELDAVRHQLDGTGRKLSADGALDDTGCGNGNDITSCSGYELVANISLAAYRDGNGWQPLGHATSASLVSGCRGANFNGIFEGNGFMISDLNINRPNQWCVGLFGQLAANSEIRNLTLRAESVIGRIAVGGLVGEGNSARIVSSSVVVDEVSGTDLYIGGLVGLGEAVEIHYSSVVAAEVRGGEDTGGLVGWGRSARIVSSSVVAAVINGSEQIGGLVAVGDSARIYSSSVVAGEVSGVGKVGGLVGDALSAQIYSSSVVVAKVGGFGNGGALAGAFNASSRVAYSYVVSDSQADALAKDGIDAGAEGAASYWYNATSPFTSGSDGEAKTSSELTSPSPYTGIYAKWGDNPVVFEDGSTSDEPLAVWCDKDNSGVIEGDEENNDNRIWDFGETNEYPAIRCTPLDPDDWRNLWSLDMDGEPQLNQMLLNNTLNQ